MRKLIYILIITILILPLSMQAAEPELYTLLEPLPCLDGVDTGCTPGNLQEKIDISSYILYVYNLAFAASVFLAIVMIIWGGFEYITSEIPFIKSDGKSKIEKAITGLVMVLASYLILQTIDPRLVNVNTELPALKVDKNKVNDYLKKQNEYQSELVKSLSAASATNTKQINDNASKLNDLRAKKAEIDEKIRVVKENSATVAPTDLDVLYSESDVIDSKIKELESSQLSLVAENKGLSRYKEIVESISLSTTLIDRSTIDGYKMITQNQYNAQINQLKSTSNVAVDKVQKLQGQRDFYVAQIEEEYLLSTEIITNSPERYVSGGTGSATKIGTDHTASLNKRREQYQLQIDNAETNAIKINMPVDQYKSIFQTRIDTINKAIKTPVKP